MKPKCVRRQPCAPSRVLSLDCGGPPAQLDFYTREESLAIIEGCRRYATSTQKWRNILKGQGAWPAPGQRLDGILTPDLVKLVLDLALRPKLSRLESLTPAAC
ncbi:hypothetical protein WJX81_005529 [Elliptochloris bilobata]|uniref:Uncharacterized protein n=1 Tax=Elliptochloris bilobata TaxID=381761 RepID=A0AAW1QXB5_9CHLO